MTSLEAPLAKSLRHESTSTSTASSPVGVGLVTDFGSNADRLAEIEASAETGELAGGDGFMFEDPATGARYRVRHGAGYVCVVPPPDQPERKGVLLAVGAPGYDQALAAHLAVVDGVERKRVQLQALVIQGADRPPIARQIYDLLVSERSSLCATLVADLEQQGVMGLVFRVLPADFLWDEDHIDDTYRILSYRDTAAVLADIDEITRKKNGKARRRLDEDDAVLVNELMDVVTLKVTKFHYVDGAYEGNRRDKKARGKVNKAINRSTRKLDEDGPGGQAMATSFVGVKENGDGVSRRQELLAQLDDAELWESPDTGQLANVLRMVLVAGHRRYAIERAEQYAIPDRHHEVLMAVGLVDEEGYFLEKPEREDIQTQGAVIEAIDFLIKTRRSGGHTKIKLFKRRLDIKNARLDELQDVTKGTLAGIRFAESDGESNMADIQADAREGYVRLQAQHLDITSIVTSVVRSGPASIRGLKVDARIPTQRNPDQGLGAQVDFDSIVIEDFMVQAPEQLVAFGRVELTKGSVLTRVLKELTSDEQAALAQALETYQDAPKRVPIAEIFGPSIRGMIDALGNLFADGGVYLSNEISIQGVHVTNMTTSSGVHQSEVGIESAQTSVGVGVESRTEQSIDIGIAVPTIEAPLDVKTPDFTLSSPLMQLEQVGFDMRLELERQPFDKFMPKSTRIESMRVGRMGGAPVDLATRSGLRATFPDLDLRDLVAKNIRLPGRGETLDAADILRDAEGSLGLLQVGSRLSSEVHNIIQAGGLIHLAGLEVSSLNSGGVAFALAELTFSEGSFEGVIPGPLSKIPGLVMSTQAGVHGVQGEATWGQDGVHVGADIDGLSVLGQGAGETGTVGLEGQAGGTRLDVAMQQGGPMSVDVSIASLLAGLDLDSPALGLAGAFALSDVVAAVSVVDGQAKVDQLRIETLEGRPGSVALREQGLHLSFDDLLINGIGASGIVLPQAGAAFSIEGLGPDASVTMDRLAVAAQVQSVVGKSLRAGGKVSMNDLRLGALASGGVGFQLGDLTLDAVHARGSRIGALIKAGKVRVSGISGEATQVADGLSVTGGVDRLSLTGGSVTAGGVTTHGSVQGSGTFVVDPDQVSVAGSVGGRLQTSGAGTLPAIPQGQGSPGQRPLAWTLPVLDALHGNLDLQLPVGSRSVPVRGVVKAGAWDAGSTLDALAVDALAFVKRRMPSLPSWMQSDLLDRAGQAIEDAIRGSARYVGDALAARIPGLRKAVEEQLNIRGPTAGGLDLSRYFAPGALDLEDQVRGALQVVAQDAVSWLGSASAVVDFAKDGFATGAKNTAKSVWYRWIAPVAQKVTPDRWQDALRVSQDRIDAYHDWNEVRNEERATYLAQAMFSLVESAADWAGDIGFDLGLNGAGAVHADQGPGGPRAIDMMADLNLTGSGSVQQGAALRMGIKTSGGVKIGRVDANGWMQVDTGVGGQVDGWAGAGQGQVDFSAGGRATIGR